MQAEQYLEFIKKGTILSKDKESVLIGWGERKWFFNPSKEDIPHFYFPDFFLKIGMPWFTHVHWTEISITELLTFFSENEKSEIDWNVPDASFTIFKEQFKELISKFESEELTKAVPYIFEETNAKMTDKRLSSSLFSTLNYISKCPALIYGLWGDGEGVLGATPEILFDQTDRLQLKTVACAGTYPSENKNFVVDSKLLLEHKIVVDGISESLQSFGTLHLEPLKAVKLPKLTHLVTPMNVKLHEPFDFKKITEALHPTPALGAFPKDQGMLFLEQYQMNIPRGRFGAPVGFSLKDSARCVVAIRNVQWDNKGMRIGAGCGIVKGSLLEAELLEIRLKLDAIKELLAL